MAAGNCLHLPQQRFAGGRSCLSPARRLKREQQVFELALLGARCSVCRAAGCCVPRSGEELLGLVGSAVACRWQNLSSVAAELFREGSLCSEPCCHHGSILLPVPAGATQLSRPLCPGLSMLWGWELLGWA